MFEWIRWRFAKKTLCTPRFCAGPERVWMIRESHRASVEDFPPTVESYYRLADVWNQYAATFVPSYGPFLSAAARHYRLPIRSVLDLACGTGLLTRQIARWADSVVGVDASAAMLRRAADRTPDRNVRYVPGDFRAFDLGETFDAVVCGGDSLNYVHAPGELTEVFRCVRRHLRPGGLFAFDVIDGQFCRAVAPMRTVAQVGRERFEVYYFYDPKTRVSEARAVLNGGVERHRRVPIDETDVRLAAGESGLVVTEHFSPNTFSLVPTMLARQFYVLRVPPE
jgi:SAM-dependent methyltransferase